MKFYLILLLALFFTACSEHKEHTGTPPGQMKGTVFFNDFESEIGWGDCQHPGLTHQVAYSGRTSVEVGNQTEYGLGFQSPLGKMIGRKPGKVSVEAWVYLPGQNSGGAIVVSVKSPVNNNNVLFWQEISLAQDVKRYNTWVKVHKVFELPPEVAFTDELSIYPWKVKGPDAFFIDDLKIVVTE